ncbi:ribosome maturation factor RimM [Pseudactinotalea terrae]|uniref:ribosome maturation factor RimM n=1 Tax=Pseudactinotalea terrae TaxID=1743262 RepID=UPI0012E0D961|nr:ribosome maturation factor RimM [Pseudactinotalea terrae]
MTEPAQVRVATLGAAHGLKGDVRLRLHTDNPAARLVPGARFTTDPWEAGPLELVAVVEHSGSTYARFAGHTDRTAAEALRGIVLLADPEDEEDAWYPEQLAGLEARRPDGTVIGTVTGVQHLPAHDVLLLREPDGARTLIPFVTAIVPTVDVPGGFVVVDPPAGLLAADADAAEE